MLQAKGGHAQELKKGGSMRRCVVFGVAAALGCSDNASRTSPTGVTALVPTHFVLATARIDECLFGLQQIGFTLAGTQTKNGAFSGQKLTPTSKN